MPRSLEEQREEKWLTMPDPMAGFYALVFETAETIRVGIAVSQWESMQYAAMWLRGTR